MSENLEYEFRVGLGRSERVMTLDLITEGYADSLEEWNALPGWTKGEVLMGIWLNFRDEEVSGGWDKIDG